MRRALLAALVLGGCAASCAPHLATLSGLDTASVRQRFERSVALRDALGAGVDAQARIWVSGSALGDLPAMSATLLLAAPDAARLRVQSVFGTALDVSARGDSLLALLPSRRVALDLVSASDTLGVPVPGPLAYRVWSATWSPPAAAWSAAVREDSLLRVRWAEGGDSLEVAIGGSGLVRRMALRRPDGTYLHWDYVAWDWIDGAPWPSRLDFGDGAGTVLVRCKLSQLRASRAPSRARFSVRLPQDVERIEWYELRRTLGNLGDL